MRTIIVAIRIVAKGLVDGMSDYAAPARAQLGPTPCHNPTNPCSDTIVIIVKTSPLGRFEVCILIFAKSRGEAKNDAIAPDPTAAMTLRYKGMDPPDAVYTEKPNISPKGL